MQFSKLSSGSENNLSFTLKHRLRHIDAHLAYFVLCRTHIQEKNSYAEPVLNKTKQMSNQGLICPLFFNKRKRHVSKMTLNTLGIVSY